ncbi:MAG: hypothetical protein KGI83_01020, partial [Verrucomicrobiota bacterium]|nr:hypothetical protein [Verrucomicrobiota bacterium]
TNQTKLGTLRSHMDLELGFGWGMYLDCNNWYIDLAAGYGFQVFYDQNMFRRYVESGTGAASANSLVPGGNLYVHGLTATATLDF